MAESELSVEEIRNAFWERELTWAEIDKAEAAMDAEWVAAQRSNPPADRGCSDEDVM